MCTVLEIYLYGCIWGHLCWQALYPKLALWVLRRGSLGGAWPNPGFAQTKGESATAHTGLASSRYIRSRTRLRSGCGVVLSPSSPLLPNPPPVSLWCHSRDSYQLCKHKKIVGETCNWQGECETNIANMYTLWQLSIYHLQYQPDKLLYLLEHKAKIMDSTKCPY